MKKIAWWLVVSLAMQGSAFAQGQGDRQTVSAVDQPCQDWPAGYDWNAVAKDARDKWCAAAKQIRTKNKQQQSGPFNEKLGIAGAATMLFGLILVTPQGHDYHILGDTYCVNSSEYSVDVDYGSCQSPSVKYGLYFLAAGGTMALIGWHHVGVSPMIGPQMKGVKTTIRWGGKR